jgi:methionine synthase II (cobalamin-independent)
MENGEKVEIKTYFDAMFHEREKQFIIQLEKIYQLFEEREKQGILRSQSDEIARRLSAENLKKDLDHLNKLRDEVVADRSLSVGKGTFDGEIKAIYADLKALEISKATLEGKASQRGVNLALLASVIGIIISIISLIVHVIK